MKIYTFSQLNDVHFHAVFKLVTSKVGAMKKKVMLALSLVLIFFSCSVVAVATNDSATVESQDLLYNVASHPKSVQGEECLKRPWAVVKTIIEKTPEEPGAFWGALGLLYMIIGAVLNFLFKVNIFSTFVWLFSLFSYKLRLRRFLSTFKGCDVKCNNPYVSIDRSCLLDVRRIVKNGRIRSGVFFFYGQRDVGKKVVLVGELHCKGMAVVQISEDKWFNGQEAHVRCEELVTALECVFPPFRRKLHLVLVLDSQIKDHNGYRQILEQTLNLLYNQLSEGVRKRVSIVVKMVGMYAARDIPDIHPIMIEPLSSKECVEFFNDYRKKKAYPFKDETVDEHVLYVNSMGHPSRLIKYLEGEGNSSDEPPATVFF